MKTHDRHLSEKEITVWIMMAVLFALTLAAGYLFWQKLALF
jgi:hypothetical protein